MSDASLRPDCAQCAGLCCVAFAFDESEHFAIDKRAGDACPNLTVHYRCRIHDSLEQAGFGGCVRYTCFGAGQRVTQELFDGGDWQRDPSILHPMLVAFRVMRQIHELLLLLNAAGELPLTPEEQAKRQHLAGLLAPTEGWSRVSLAAFERGSVADDARAFFRSLRSHVELAGPLATPGATEPGEPAAPEPQA